MAEKITERELNEKLRVLYLDLIKEILTEKGEEVLRTASNEICIPCVDEGGNDKYLVVTVKVPTGSRDGEAYDGYSIAEAYAMTVAEKAEKKAIADAKKAKKIAQDEAKRKQMAEAKAKREADKKNGEG